MKILDLPLRFATFLVLICIFFATDFVYLWDLSFSVNWTPFLIVSLILFLTFVYHKRKALKTLATVSESNVTKGGILLLLALIIYVLGSYVDNLFFFHYFALILFSMACLFLGFDRRIPKILLIPMVFVLLIFMIPFTIEIVTFNGNIALNFLTVYLIGTFLLAIMAITLARQFFATRKDRRGKTQQKNSGCPMCKSQKFKDVVFCYWCGQQLLKPKPNTIKNFAIRFLLIYLIVGVLLFANVPTFSIENGEALTTLYTIRGRQKQSLIQMPNGWILNSSTRLVDYERVYNEDFATLTTYISHGGGNVFSILLEVSSQKPYAMNDWKLPNWQKVSEEIVFLDEKTLGHLIFLQKNNETIMILYWPMRMMFIVGTNFIPKNVGLSIYTNFTESITESPPAVVSEEAKNIGLFVYDHLTHIGLWTTHLSTLNQIYSQFKDLILSICGAVSIILVAGLVRSTDKISSKTIENMFLALENKRLRLVLVAISKSKLKFFTEREIFNVYQSMSKGENENGWRDFHGRILMLQELGLLKTDYVIKKNVLVMGWRSNFPM